VARSKKLRVFLSHAKEDKSLVREISHLLRLDGFDPWLDAEKLVAGSDWKYEIEKAVQSSDMVVIFISASGIDRAGYLHKELALAIDVAEQWPQGTIFLIPVRLGDCTVPRRLADRHYVEVPNDPAAVPLIYAALQRSLLTRAQEAGLVAPEETARKNVYGFGAKGLPGFSRPDAGRYLVWGQNPDQSKYYGTASVEVSSRHYRMVWSIGERRVVFEGGPDLYEEIMFDDKYVVEYFPADRDGIFHGRWGDGGNEALIPMSPDFSPTG
jgi:TIR domain